VEVHVRLDILMGNMACINNDEGSFLHNKGCSPVGLFIYPSRENFVACNNCLLALRPQKPGN